MKKISFVLLLTFVFIWILLCSSPWCEARSCQSEQTADLINKGKKLVQEAKWEEAIVVFNKAIEINPNDPEAHFGLAEVYWNLIITKKTQGDFKNLEDISAKFTRELEKTLALNPNHIQALFKKASTYLFSPPQYGGDVDKAIKALEYIVAKEPQNIDYLFYLGLAYKKKEKREEAKEAFMKILKLAPDHPNAKEQLEQLKVLSLNIEKVNPIFDDFEDNDFISNWNTKWIEMTDKYAGGNSISKIQINDEGADNSKRCLKITGKVTTQFAYGFAGIYANFDPASFEPTSGNPVDLSKFQGIQFYAKGDGNKYRINFVTDNIKDFDYFMFLFSASEDWKLIKIPFKELKQFGFGAPSKWTGKDVQGIQILTFTFPGMALDSFELNIDKISFY